MTLDPSLEHDLGPKRRAGAMGRVVGGGMSWLLLASLVVKLGALGNQVALGWLLEDGDFGVFGAAIGVAALVNVLRDGGVRRILIQKGRHRYQGLVGPVYALTVLLNIAAAAILVALGPAMAAFHGDERFVAVMGSLALAAACYGPSMIYRARLALDLRFKALAGMNTWSALARYASMIALAAAGAGPTAFTWSLLVVALFEWAYGLWLTGDPLIRPRIRPRLWPAILARAKWLLLGALSLALLRQGDYLVLGALMEPQVLGLYVFAFMLGEQVQTLVAGNLQQVLTPAMASFQHEPHRHAQAVVRSAGAMTMVAAIIAGGIAAVVHPLETVLWNGRWALAVPAAQALALCFALRLLVSVQDAALVSVGRYRLRWGVLTFQGVGMALAAGIGGALFPDSPGAVALFVGLYFVLGVAGIAALALARIGVPARPLLVAVYTPWAIATSVAALAILADALFLQTQAAASSRGGAILRLAALGAGYSILTIALLRLLLPGLLGQVMTIAPGPIARVARRALSLPAAAPQPPTGPAP